MTGSMATTLALADFAATLEYDEIPTSVALLAKKCLLDCLGVALAASGGDDQCRMLHDVFSSDAGPCLVFGYGGRLSPPSAALVNGALVHALNYDPIGEKAGHLGVACLAAPYALGETTEASGKDLITSAVVACEVSARVTAAIVAAGRRPSEKFLSGQMLSYFGAAAGAARILRLDPTGMQSALGLALMQMSGSRQLSLATGAPAKSVYGAFPSQAGVTSALLAKGGLDACCDIFGEPAGLFSAIYGGGIDVAPISAELKQTYCLTDVSIKPWPSSNQTFPHIEAAVSARRQISDPKDIEEIEIIASPKVANWCEPFASKRNPPNAAAAANSIPFCVASTLARGAFDLDSFEDVGNQESLTHKLLGLVRYTQGQTSDVAQIRIRMSNGGEVSTQAQRSPPDTPIEDAALLAKFMNCGSRSFAPISDGALRELASMILDLENVASIGAISRLMEDGQ